jgi:hypothetical protein
MADEPQRRDPGRDEQEEMEHTGLEGQRTPEDFNVVELGEAATAPLEPFVPLDGEDIEHLYIERQDEDGLRDQIDDYTDDPDVIDDFVERQGLAQGRDRLLERLDEHNSLDPTLSGGDIDARWEEASVSGEEAVGGETPTPDQDRVEELGEAMGIEYDLDEPLRTEEKLAARDEHRWELNPASAEDAEELADE